MNASIPRHIHQTWRDREVPASWRSFQASWRRHNPGWNYILWTDADLRRLILEDYPWFLTIYDNYAEPIQRVDAARYFLMHRHGGVYADLDFECLRPLDALLDGHDLVVGREPEAHLAKAVVRAHGLEEKVVGNAFLASRPGHRFWEHVFLELVGAHDRPGALVSTGPFLLTGALDTYRGPDPVSCLPAALLYPGTSEEAAAGRLLDPTWRASPAAQQAYAIHHWSGSWINADADDETRDGDEALPGSEPDSVPLTLVARGEPVFEGEWSVTAPSPGASDAPPLVSCLMVTRSSRLDFVRRAIACFQAQSYPARELVIVDDGEGREIAQHVEALADPAVRLERLTPEGLPLGALRNIAVDRARGAYVTQWDDDDLVHPRRIELQLAALQSAGADACLLSRWRIWWPHLRRLAISKARAWEGSLLCRRERLPRYDDSLRRGEDTPVVLRLASRERVAFLDAPWLYTYVVHAANTTDARHLDEHWAQATQFHWNGTYASAVRRMATPLPDTVRAAVLAQLAADPPSSDPRTRTPSSPAAAAVVDFAAATTPRPQQLEHAPARPAAASGLPPKVLILTPVKDGLPFFDSFFSGLERLDYPPSRLSLALLEGDSVDATYAALAAKLPALQRRFARAELFKRDFQLRLVGSRSDAGVQMQRRSVLARSRNCLLSHALRDEDWVLWLDFDVIDYPPDVLSQLLATGKEIVVPHCVLAPAGRTFDLNTFIISTAEAEAAGLATATGTSGGADGSSSLAQPERGEGRLYLEDVRDRELVEVDGVGGTMLLVRADLHREGLIFPAAPYRRHLETEGMAFLARDLGLRCWGLPKLEIIHANR